MKSIVILDATLKSHPRFKDHQLTRFLQVLHWLGSWCDVTKQMFENTIASSYDDFSIDLNYSQIWSL